MFLFKSQFDRLAQITLLIFQKIWCLTEGMEQGEDLEKESIKGLVTNAMRTLKLRSVKETLASEDGFTCSIVST